MHPEVDSDMSAAEVDSVVLLNPVTFNLAMLALSVAETDAARARVLGVDAKSVRAALDGKPVGGRMIGKTITAFRRHEKRLARLGLRVDIDTYFTVRELTAAVL